jgi:hypothetical protein
VFLYVIVFKNYDKQNLHREPQRSFVPKGSL